MVESVFVRRRALAAVFSVLLVHPVLAQNSQTAGETAHAQLSVSSIRIDNFGQVNPNYFRGAQPRGQDYSSLAKLGIKTLISLTSDDSLQNERSLAEQAGLKFVKIPMSTRVVPTAESSHGSSRWSPIPAVSRSTFIALAAATAPG